MDYKSLILHDSVELDLLEALEWYNAKLYGLGLRFYDELHAYFLKIQRSPFAFSYYNDYLRSVEMHKFPYFILFEERENAIYIYALIHSKRSKRYIQRRITSGNKDFN